MIAASAYSAPAAPSSMGEAFAAWRQNLDHGHGRAPSIISLSDEDDAGRLPAAKRAKVAVLAVGTHGSSSRSTTSTTMSTAAGEARRRQNRESARKSRLRKKLRERELRGDVAFYTRSNQSLAKQNAELQLMLDEARARVNSADRAGSTDQAGHVPEIQVAPASPSASNVNLGAAKDTKTKLDAPQLTSKKRAVISPITSPAEEAGETNDQGFDYIDILLESDDWLLEDDGNVSDCTAGTLSAASSNEIPIIDRRARTISPAIAPASRVDEVISNPIPTPSNLQAGRARSVRPSNAVAGEKSKLTRREKGHIYARNARLRKKAEHERLRASAEYYARSNEVLRERNKELQMMLLRARNKVAESTDGFRHYSSVFGSRSGRACTAGNEVAVDGSDSSPVGGQCCVRSVISDVVHNLQSDSKRDQHGRRSSIGDVDLDVEDIDVRSDPDMEEWMSYLLE